MKNGAIISDEIKVADAHPSGRRPFARSQYIQKFKNLTDGIITKQESERFLKLVQNLKKLGSRDLLGLNLEARFKVQTKRGKKVIF